MIIERGGFLFIQMIDKKHLKVELDYNDMAELCVERTSFALRDKKAKDALKLILRSAYEQTGFDIFHAKFLVEIFPIHDEGCLILFTKDEVKRYKAKSIKKSSVYRFSDANSLLDCINAFSDIDILKISEIYKFKGSFYLCFLDNFSISAEQKLLISEFSGEPDKISPLFLKEHSST